MNPVRRAAVDRVVDCDPQRRTATGADGRHGKDRSGSAAGESAGVRLDWTGIPRLSRCSPRCARYRHIAVFAGNALDPARAIGRMTLDCEQVPVRRRR